MDQRRRLRIYLFLDLTQYTLCFVSPLVGVLQLETSRLDVHSPFHSKVIWTTSAHHTATSDKSKQGKVKSFLGGGAGRWSGPVVFFLPSFDEHNDEPVLPGSAGRDAGVTRLTCVAGETGDGRQETKSGAACMGFLVSLVKLPVHTTKCMLLRASGALRHSARSW